MDCRKGSMKHRSLVLLSRLTLASFYCRTPACCLKSQTCISFLSYDISSLLAWTGFSALPSHSFYLCSEERGAISEELWERRGYTKASLRNLDASLWCAGMHHQWCSLGHWGFRVFQSQSFKLSFCSPPPGLGTLASFLSCASSMCASHVITCLVASE